MRAKTLCTMCSLCHNEYVESSENTPSLLDTERFPLLAQIASPADLKALDTADLPALAAEMRTYLVEVISRTGGHLASNLGAVELSIALHRVFDTPEDKIVFDVGHQSYVHKLLTGRAENFSTLRQHGGVSGFPCRDESEHDAFGAGHAGTAFSAALGLAVGRDLHGGDEHVICVAGDATFTCGVSFEALNNVATRKLILVLNDNEWAITKNVGAIARYFNRLTTHPTYVSLREKTAQFVERTAGKQTRNLVHKVTAGVKNILAPSVIFEDFGMRYYGPVDGHNIDALVEMLQFLKQQPDPVVLHIITQKGKGYEPAAQHPATFHGLGKFDPDSGLSPCSALPTYSQIFGETLARFARDDKRLVAITAAMSTGTGLTTFEKEHPDRFFDVGIAEEHAGVFAAALAARELKPFLAIYSTFMQRTYDMILHDIALQNLNVALCLDRAGLSADDGPTHHGLYDIAYLRTVPGLVHMQPKDEAEFTDMLWTMANYSDGPIAIRYPRGAGTGAKPAETPKLLEIGKSEILREGADVALIALGNMVALAEEVADTLKTHGIEATIVNARWIKPLDTAVLDEYAARHPLICTIEDHCVVGGFGAAVAEHFVGDTIDSSRQLLRFGWPDKFIEHGSLSALREKYHLTASAITEKILATLKQK